MVLVRVRAEGLEFDVRAGGPAGGEPVLLLHGFPQHGGMWDGVTPALWAAGLRTYAPDQRGYSPGARPSDVDTYTMRQFVQDALSILDALDIEQTHVIGHDWGSVVSWHLAASHADRVRSLTAVSVPHPRAISHARHNDGGEQKRRSEYMRLFATPGEAEDALLADGAARLWGLFEPLRREQAEAYVRPLLEPGALTTALNWYRRLERPELGPARVPVTYLWGTEDSAMARSSAQACVDWVEPGQDYRFLELAGISHWVADEVPATVADATLARISWGSRR